MDLVELQRRVYRACDPAHATPTTKDARRARLVHDLVSWIDDSPAVVADLFCVLKMRRFPGVEWKTHVGRALAACNDRTVTRLCDEWTAIWNGKRGGLDVYGQVARLREILGEVKTTAAWTALRAVARAIRAAWPDERPSLLWKQVGVPVLEWLWRVGGVGDSDEEDDGYAGVRLWVALDTDVSHFATPFEHAREAFALAVLSPRLRQGQDRVNRAVHGLFHDASAYSACWVADGAADRAADRAADSLAAAGKTPHPVAKGVRARDWFDYWALLHAYVLVPDLGKAGALAEASFVDSRAHANAHARDMLMNEASYVQRLLHRASYAKEAAQAPADVGAVHGALSRVYSHGACSLGWRLVFPKTTMHQHMKLSWYLDWLVRDVRQRRLGPGCAWRAMLAAIKHGARQVTDVTVSDAPLDALLDQLGVIWSINGDGYWDEDPAAALRFFATHVYSDRLSARGAVTGWSVALAIRDVVEFVNVLCELYHLHRVPVDEAHAPNFSMLASNVAIAAAVWLKRVVGCLYMHETGRPFPRSDEEIIMEQEEEEEEEEEEEQGPGSPEPSATAAPKPEDDGDFVFFGGELVENAELAKQEEKKPVDDDGDDDDDDDDDDHQDEPVLGDGVETARVRLVQTVDFEDLADLSVSASASLHALLAGVTLDDVQRHLAPLHAFSAVAGAAATHLLHDVRAVLTMPGQECRGCTHEAQVCMQVMDAVHDNKTTPAVLDALFGPLLEATGRPWVAVNGVLRATARLAVQARKCDERARNRVCERLGEVWRYLEGPVGGADLSLCRAAHTLTGNGVLRLECGSWATLVDARLVRNLLTAMHGSSFMQRLLYSVRASPVWGRVLSMPSHDALWLRIVGSMRSDSALAGWQDKSTCSSHQRACTLRASLYTLANTLKLFPESFFATCACNGLMEELASYMDHGTRVRAILAALMHNGHVSVRDLAGLLRMLRDSTTRDERAKALPSSSPHRGPRLLEALLAHPRPVLDF